LGYRKGKLVRGKEQEREKLPLATFDDIQMEPGYIYEFVFGIDNNIYSDFTNRQQKVAEWIKGIEAGLPEVEILFFDLRPKGTQYAFFVMPKDLQEYELFVQVRLRENYSGAFISTTGLIALGLVSTVIIATSFALVRSIESVERFPESNFKAISEIFNNIKWMGFAGGVTFLGFIFREELKKLFRKVI
jgi:hypothetical protein